MFFSIFDDDGLVGRTDVVSQILLKVVHPLIDHRLFVLEIVVVGPNLIHVEPLRDVKIGLKVGIVLEKGVQLKNHRVQSYRGLNHHIHVSQGVEFVHVCTRGEST